MHRALPALVTLAMVVLGMSNPAAGRNRHLRPDDSSGASEEATAIRLRDAALAGRSHAWATLSELTTRFGPRPAGSLTERSAAEWLRDRLQAAGFAAHIEDFPITAWERGDESAVLEGPIPQHLAAAALGGSPATPPEGVSGEVRVFGDLEALRAIAPGSLRGAIALVSDRMVRAQDGSGYDVAVAKRLDGPALAAERGAIAFLMRSAGTDAHRMAHTGTSHYVAGRMPVPAFALSNPDADQLERLAALNAPVRVRLISTAHLRPDARSQNVVAELRGARHPEQIVLLGAHLDSWDLGTGAVDDGAGVAIVTAAVQLIHDAGLVPDRTVRIVLFGCEEQAQPDPDWGKGVGSAGGRAYAAQHAAELAGHVLAGESDLGADRIYRMGLTASEPEFAERLRRVVAPLGILPAARPPEDAGADVEATIHTGVPAIGFDQDATRYFDLHHTADDTLDKVDRAQLEQNVAAWAALAWLASGEAAELRSRKP